MNNYHYIITGAGCAGLSLLMRMLESGRFADKKILVVDQAPKESNDRTWCFWEKAEGFFEPVVCKTWEKIWIHGDHYSQLHDVCPYRYKMIRSEDFYRHCFEKIKQHRNVSVQYGKVDRIAQDSSKVTIYTGSGEMHGNYLFNSILFDKPVLSGKQVYLLQHFRGRVIETVQPVFNPAEATLMDFRVPQTHGTTFVYVMPFTERKALVEYTLISRELLHPSVYTDGITEYLNRLWDPGPWQVLEEESGAIPMTSYRFPKRQGRIVHIGTAAGQTRPSSGYTFQFIQKQAHQIVQALIAEDDSGLSVSGPSRRAHWYDTILLHILANRQQGGDEIFTRLFRNNKAARILQFLDDETSLLQELRIIASLPSRPFIKAAWQQLLP